MKSLRHLENFILALLLVVGLSLTACSDEPASPVPPPGESGVTGVINDEGGMSVPNAVVEAIDGADAVLAADTTDDLGSFVLRGLPVDLGSLRVRVRHEDFQSFVGSLSGVVGEAGGPTGVLLRILHDDSCCARLNIVVGVANASGLVSGAEVRLRRGSQLVTTGYTDSLGRVSFQNVCRGEFNIRVAKDGYTVLERDGIRVLGCDTTRMEVGLQPRSGGGTSDSCCRGVLRIVPRDSATNSVISGASVRISRSGATTRTLESGAEGVTFREVCAGQYAVRIARDGDPAYRVVEFSVNVGCNDTVTVNRTMIRVTNTGGGDSCCRSVRRIIVRDSVGNAVLTGASVRLTLPNGQTRTAESTGDGPVFRELCRGLHWVRIARDGYRVAEFSIEVGCSDTATVTRLLGRTSTSGTDTCCNGSVAVIVRDSSNSAALSGATVRLWRGSMQVASLTTGTNGSVSFTALCRGEYSVSISRDGYRGSEFSFELGCNQSREFGRKLLSNATVENCCSAVLRLRVKDSTIAEGGWLNGVSVTITKGGAQVASGSTIGEGNFGREELCAPETYSVTFSKTGYRSKTVTFRFERCTTIQETIRLVPE